MLCQAVNGGYIEWIKLLQESRCLGFSR
jgi:hypothetical protein